MPNMSPSSYNDFHTCNRLFYWKHLIKLDRVREQGARRFGTMYHAGLDAWWRSMDGGNVPWRDKDGALVMALRGIRENAEAHPETDPFEAARAEAMMVAYHARYFELEFEPVVDGEDGVEQWFNLPLVDGDGVEVPGWRLVGRKDAIKRFADGRTKPVEHKSTEHEIGPGADYWKGIAVDTQVSVYIDVARRLGVETDRMLYDVSRKPALRPLLATPPDRRRMTKGKGCKLCGGRAGGKEGPARGTGEVMASVPHPVTKRNMDQKVRCEPCDGSGWIEAPRLNASQREDDEDRVAYAGRIADEIASDGNAYFRMADVVRTPDELAEAREDLVVTSATIHALTTLAQRHNDMSSDRARRSFPRAPRSCTNQYGRACDYLPVCSRETEPFTSGLYQIRKKGGR
jgi:PD-(D/E)XK nuclease superfamily